MVTYKRTFGARAIGVRCESCYTNHSNSVHDRREPRQVEAVETFSDQRTNTPRVALLLLCIFCIFAIICFGVVYVVGDLAKYQEAISAKESQTALLGVNRGVANECDLLFEGVAPLQTAGPNEVSFLDNRRYASALDQTLAGAVIVHPDMAARVPARTVAIVTTEPYAAWARVAALFYPVPPVCPGIHPSAIVAEGALVDPSAEVGPLPEQR